MLFNSYTFLGFIAVVLILHSLPLPWRLRKFNLLMASYIFYAAWSPPFVILIWVSTLIDWFVAKAMPRAKSAPGRRGLLIVSLCANLGLLGFFKYGNFLTENFALLVSALGIEYEPPHSNIVLPVGISFYTFQTLSYTMEVYRGNTKPWDSFLDYALYVTFFPQLVAGPIVRSVDFLPQCRQPRRASAHQLSWGLTLLTLGLFEKVVVADGLLAPQSDKVFSAVEQVRFADAWFGTFAFSGQIFCDFAGYSTCAIGVALCLGFKIQDNFRFPYAAVGFSDFWRRWHISLSSWLRDYLYISLGGNRKGRGRTHINLMLTMLLGGLWHGASWTFVFWGGLHGIYLVIERLLKSILAPGAYWEKTVVRFGLGIGTYLLVCLAWVFFRAQDFSSAFSIVQSMTGLGGLASSAVLKTTELGLVGAVTLGMLLLHWALRESSVEEGMGRLPWPLRSVFISGMLVAIATMSGDSRAFIYFQF